MVVWVVVMILLVIVLVVGFVVAQPSGVRRTASRDADVGGGDISGGYYLHHDAGDAGHHGDGGYDGGGDAGGDGGGDGDGGGGGGD